MFNHIMNSKYIRTLLFLLLTSPLLVEKVEGKRMSLYVVQCDTLINVWNDYMMIRSMDVNNNLYGTSIQSDTVSILYDKYFGVLNYLNNPTTPERHIVIDPDYYKLFVPFTYYNSSIERISHFDWKPKEQYWLQESSKPKLYDESIFTYKERINALVDKILLNIYLTSPNNVVYTEQEIMSVKAFSDDIADEASSRPRVTTLYKKGDVANVTEKAGVVIHKPNWWTFGGGASLQMTQNYISDNWYKGGESNVAMLGALQLYANYNDKECVQWENSLDAKLGFASTPSDTVHNYLTNTDQLKLYSKLGVRAAVNWYYTVSTEMKTQFLNSYHANNKTVVASFLAPLDWSTSVGMDYKLNKPKFSLSLFLAPLSHSMRYVGNKKVNETSYGLEKGKHVKHNWGSKFDATLKWNIISSITFNSHLVYQTSYDWTRIEWENTFNFVLNRYLSTQLYIHTRFDDSVPRADDEKNKSYFQVKELLSFGLNYSF